MGTTSYERSRLETTPCPVCTGSDAEVFFRAERAPVFCNVLCQTQEQALQAETATIALAHCPACGLVYNACFEEQRVPYAPGYENSLFFSPHYRHYARSSAQRLVEQYDVREKVVVEIGCGTGDFLGLLAEMGDNRTFGFDPSHDPVCPAQTRRVSASGAVTVVPEVFAPGRSAAGERPDLVCCRHVLEHVADPLSFLQDVRQAMGADPHSVLHVEVPNGRFVLGDHGIWDILYEHCFYFTQEALTYLLERAGFEVLEACQRYDGQFLTIEGRPQVRLGGSSPCPQDQTEVAALVGSFRARSEARVRTWRHRLARPAKSARRHVLWGAGSKGVMFLNVLGVDCRTVACVVDINSKKHGRFIPGTGQEVIGPEDLRAIEPHGVILMNPVYREEVARMLADLGLTCEIVSAWD